MLIPDDGPVAEPVTLDDVRSFLQLPDDHTEDPMLSSAIAMCREELEGILSIYISARTVVLSLPSEVRAHPLRGPVDSVTVVAETMDGLRDCTARSKVMPDVVVFPSDVEHVLRWRVSVSTSIVCPPSVRMALLMMVRNLWTDRGADPLTDDVRRMVSQFTAVNI